jgi:glutamine synthetase
MSLTVDELRAATADGTVDEVILALPDLTGRLVGSGLDPSFFTAEVLTGGFGACAYLLACDVEMESGPGYAYEPWAQGFGDFRLMPDPATLRRAPWQPSSAIVLADAWWLGGGPVRVAPRQVLRAQLDRLAGLGLTAHAGTELEFLVFTESYEEAARRGYGSLTPATRYNVDYALTGTSGLDALVTRIRRAMSAAGVRVESARAEIHPGQYEIVFRYADALATCDNHALYKTAARNIAAATGQALTFMAKYDAGEGNSCHVHLSLRDDAGRPVFASGAGGRGGTDEGSDERADAGRGGADDDQAAMSPLMASFVAGQLAAMAELTLLFAPTVNAYKRLAPGAFAPTGIAWGRDNRTCPVRVVGSGPSLRIEHRVPGGDVNPYLAVAGIIAAGLHGIEKGLELPPPVTGNAFADPSVPRLPATLAEAAGRWRSSALARAAFGDDVVDHYAHAADVELAAYATTVTDWERRRAFERL